MNQRERMRAAQGTLREFFQRDFLPLYLIEAAPATIAAYGETIGHWERITRNPRLCDIDSRTLAEFKTSLRSPQKQASRCGRQPPQRLLFDLGPSSNGHENNGHKNNGRVRPLAIATVNKHIRHLLAILGKAGMAGPRNRDALGVLEITPWTRPLKQHRRQPRNVPDATIAPIYRAAESARYPELEDVSPVNWWRALLVVALTTGFRREGLLGLRWDEVDWTAKEIRLDAAHDKCGVDRCKPLHSAAIRHLLRIRSGGGGGLIFPWPQSLRTFYRQWHRIQDAAGIPISKHIKLHDLKRACGTRFARVGSTWVVQKMLDHANISTSQHYINAEDEARAAIERLPLPEVFSAGCG